MAFRSLVGLLLGLSAFPCQDLDVTSHLDGLVVYFENVEYTDSWLGLTEHFETLTIHIPGEGEKHSINIFDPVNGVRNLFQNVANKSDNALRYASDGGQCKNPPATGNQRPWYGMEWNSEGTSNVLEDRNVDEIKFQRQEDTNNTDKEEQRWRIKCEDDTMTSCVVISVKYNQYLFSRGPNMTLGTERGCYDEEGQDCPPDCSTDADCFSRGQCVFCRSNECVVDDECCSCSLDTCETYDDASLQSQCKCGQCGQHCMDAQETCPETESSAGCAPQDPDKPESLTPRPPAKWVVLVPGFESQVEVLHRSECNWESDAVDESVTISRGISLHEDAGWQITEDNIDDIVEEVKRRIKHRETEDWDSELETKATWRPAQPVKIPIKVPFGHRTTLTQLRGTYGSSQFDVYTVRGEAQIRTEKCIIAPPPDCLENDGSESPECPANWEHHWDYEPEGYKRPHETSKSCL